MNLNIAKTGREVALEIPAPTRVFEKLGIEYCGGGNKSLEEACGAVNLEIPSNDGPNVSEPDE